MSKFLLNRLNIQFNLNECIVENTDGDVIALGLCENNLYKIKFIEVHEAYATNYIYSH